MSTIEEINNYVNSKEHSGALLLTGEWGSGKSHQVHQYKKQAKDKLILVVSLFGIENVNDIEKVIKDRFIHELASKITNISTTNNLWKCADFFSKLSDDVRKIRSTITVGIYDLIDIQKNINIKGESKELILVFDDFERSTIDIANLLGTINEYCENRNIKVIIVADETKIGNNAIEQTEKYKEFKEKVIQTTIRVESNYNDIIHNIVSLYSETSEGYKNFLLNNISNLYLTFEESEYRNLRTLKSILIGFERVYEQYIKVSHNDYAALSDILYSYAAMMYEMKYGNVILKNNRYIDFTSNKEDKYSKFNNNGSALNSIKQYIYTNILDKELFVEEVKNRYFNSRSPVRLFLDSDFWGLNAQIIKEGVPSCLSMAYEGELTIDEYVRLLSYLANLLNIGIELPCELDFKKMKAGLNLLRNRVMENKCLHIKKNTFVSNEQIKILGHDAIEFNNILETYGDKIECIKNAKAIIEQLNSDCDFTGLHKISVDRFDETFKESLLNAYERSSNNMKHTIGPWFYSISFDNLYCSDIEDIHISFENMKLLGQELEKMIEKEHDSFTNIINNEFLQLIKEKTTQLNQTLHLKNKDVTNND